MVPRPGTDEVNRQEWKGCRTLHQRIVTVTASDDVRVNFNDFPTLWNEMPAIRQ